MYIFTAKELIPESAYWTMYGKVHLTWLFLILVEIISACIIYKKSDSKKRDRIVKGFAILILIQEILKDLIHIICGTIELEHLPFHLCGISIFIILAFAFWPNKTNREMLYALVLPGAAAALIFPNWLNYPFPHFSHLNSFTIHAWLVTVPIMLLVSGDFRPNYKNLPRCYLFLILIGIPIYIFNKIFGTNFMFINVPSPGSPLVPLANIFGNPGYIFAGAALIWVVWFVMYLPWEIFSKKKEKEINI